MDQIKAINEEKIFELVANTKFRFDLLLKDYYITILLYILKDVEGIYFKGGTALQKIFLNYSRISEDIDYTLTRSLREVRQEIQEKIGNSGIFKEITTDKDVEGFVRLVVHYQGFGRETGTVFIDLNERGKILLEPEKHVITHLYSENIPSFSVATLHSKEMMAEKISAAIGRNRPRDHFDLYKIVQHKFPLDLELVKQKCISSGDEFDIIKMFNKAQQLKKRWDQDLAPLLVENVTFPEVMTTLAKHFDLKGEKEKKKKINEEIRNSEGYKKLLNDIGSIIKNSPPEVKRENLKNNFL